ncbi:BgtA-20316 [Blumeria graminis f. sp. tritici]|uniref:BgtA-20316 n=2 Tax=Blumeria graminis f. sp. tritici TaxID=62690 RepID=A0A9X9MEN5_BLUGR|nr:hypothetical protein BGT96224_A20316 [Blumeria graminis f. sp. tritici 96224]VDB83676.1 BgtA-20316 [Blumeria graminis f. sp. tritici]
MAPQKHKLDESRSDAVSTKEKSSINNTSITSSKCRRLAGPAIAGSSSQDTNEACYSPQVTGSMNSEPGDQNPLQWSSFESPILHAYRYDYRLNTPAAFHKSYNQMTLSKSSMGRMSPTMASKKCDRRQSKDQLAAAVKKHFKSMGIVENDVIVEFLYKVRHQDKSFRMRFSPNDQKEIKLQS